MPSHSTNRFAPFLLILLLLLLVTATTSGCAAQTWFDTLEESLTAVPPDTLALTITPTFGPTITREPTASMTPTVTPSATPTITPTPTPTRVPEIIGYTDPQNRFVLEMPDTWLVNDEDEAALVFASDETRLNFNTLDEGVSLFIFPGEVAVSETLSPTAVLEEFITNFVVFDSEEIVEPPTAVRIGGQDAAVARADGVFNRFPVLVEYYVFVRGNRFVVVVVMLARESAPDYLPVTTQLVRSLRLR